MNVKVFGYLILLSIDFLQFYFNLCYLFSFSFDLVSLRKGEQKDWRGESK